MCQTPAPPSFWDHTCTLRITLIFFNVSGLIETWITLTLITFTELQLRYSRSLNKKLPLALRLQYLKALKAISLRCDRRLRKTNMIGLDAIFKLALAFLAANLLH